MLKLSVKLGGESSLLAMRLGGKDLPSQSSLLARRDEGPSVVGHRSLAVFLEALQSNSKGILDTVVYEPLHVPPSD